MERMQSRRIIRQLSDCTDAVIVEHGKGAKGEAALAETGSAAAG